MTGENTIRRRIGRAACCVVIACITSGCAGGRYHRAGRDAEKQGDAAVAYDQYLRAADRHSDSAVVASALNRVRNAASSEWEQRAVDAERNGRLDEAWQYWMRALEIRPDHPRAATRIRALEDNRPDAVIAVRNNWLARGPSTLPAAPSSIRIARADPRDARIAAPAGDSRATDRKSVV